MIFFLVGGCIQGCMGFGLAMVAVPPLLMVLPATTVVPTLVMLSLLNTSAMTWQLRKDVRMEIAGPLAAGALIGAAVSILNDTSQIPGTEIFVRHIAIGLVVGLVIMGVVIHFMRRDKD